MILSILLSPPPSCVQIFSSASCFQSPSASRCRGNVSIELFPNDGCCTVACLHSSNLVMGHMSRHVNIHSNNSVSPASLLYSLYDNSSKNRPRFLQISAFTTNYPIFWARYMCTDLTLL
jgi:hypothetical protein